PPGRYQLSISGFETNHSATGDSGGPDPDLWLSIPNFNLTADRVQALTIPTHSLVVQVVDRDGRPTVQPLVADSTANALHQVELFPGGLASGRLEDSGNTAPDGTATLQVLSGSIVDLTAGWEYPLGTATVSGDAAT